MADAAELLNLPSADIPTLSSTSAAGGYNLLSVSDGDTSVGLVSRRMNRFGSITRKVKSHATLLGYHAKNYTPADKLQEVLQATISSAHSAPSVRHSPKSILEQDEEAHAMEVEIEHLKQVGLNLDEITEFVYEYYHYQALPNFMRFLHLDQDGGLDRVKQLWLDTRIFWAVLLFFFVGMNVWYLISSNWIVFESLLTHVCNFKGSKIEVDLTLDLETMESSAGGEITDIYSHIKDPKRRLLILQLAGVVGTCEVLWVMVKILHTLHQLRIFLCHKSEYRQWAEITNLFQESLPVLSTFSLLKFVSFVHPSLIASQYWDMLQQRSCLPDSVWGTILMSLYFILTRMVVAALAVAAFAIKLLSVGLHIIDSRHTLFGCFMQSALLMNQCMGCVLFERVLQDRIFLFIFGGSDTEFREDELALKGVYRCRLAKQIWEEFWVKAPAMQRWKAIVLLATFDHFDLQMLLINESAEDIHHAVSGIGSYPSSVLSSGPVEKVPSRL